MAKAKTNNSKEEPLETQLWKAADKLWNNIDAAEYKHVVLGLIFLRYISDAFMGLYDKLKTEFEEQLKEETRLNMLIAENLAKVKV